MKTIIKNLELELSKLTDLIQDRGERVYNMSAKWQESQKCEEWEDKTEEIEEQGVQLQELISNLKELA